MSTNDTTNDTKQFSQLSMAFEDLLVCCFDFATTNFTLLPEATGDLPVVKRLCNTQN